MRAMVNLIIYGDEPARQSDSSYGVVSSDLNKVMLIEDQARTASTECRQTLMAPVIPSVVHSTSKLQEISAGFVIESNSKSVRYGQLSVTGGLCCKR